MNGKKPLNLTTMDLNMFGVLFIYYSGTNINAIIFVAIQLQK